ncbi:unnamed protein product [Bursaphelenchus xylophilus]|uniref:(pine wood nematode) hypothetical protein n=1 Tax=Bursaphelenchus xylophilus TaxID=6326 RepID=A0A1I7S146_BURXY|nr:unnamed protein product [Bursaphelenchus xylophilus]CAG9079962.1 unnamed protein product [Bursaphelenchus xylophilus]
MHFPNNAVVFPPADGNPAGTSDRNFAISFPSGEPPGPSGIRPSEPLDGRTGIGEVEHAQAGKGGFLVDVLEYKQAHRNDFMSSDRCMVKCEILFLLHHAYTAYQKKNIELAPRDVAERTPRRVPTTSLKRGPCAVTSILLLAARES